MVNVAAWPHAIMQGTILYPSTHPALVLYLPLRVGHVLSSIDILCPFSGIIDLPPYKCVPLCFIP